MHIGIVCTSTHQMRQLVGFIISNSQNIHVCGKYYNYLCVYWAQATECLIIISYFTDVSLQFYLQLLMEFSL